MVSIPGSDRETANDRIAASQCGHPNTMAHSHSYAGITRIRFEGPDEEYRPSQPASASAPWNCGSILAGEKRFVKSCGLCYPIKNTDGGHAADRQEEIFP